MNAHTQISFAQACKVDRHQKPIILVDGSSYLYRAFHAPGVGGLTTGSGQPTGAIYGVVNMLLKLRSSYHPDKMAVVFDAPGKNFRHELYADYKANRPPMPDELRSQVEPLHEIIKALGLPLLMVDRVEADDVIGTLTQQATQACVPVVVSTGDKDMAQLVNGHVTLINTMSNKQFDVDGVVEKFGVRPDQIIDYLALIGDTSDNIPGVDKVGPKTATKWLKQYDTLENIISHADDFKGKVGENLRAALAQLPVSKQLATIDCDVSLPLSIEDIHVSPPVRADLRRLYQQFEFRTWLQELDNAESTDIEPDIDVSEWASSTVDTAVVDRSSYATLDQLDQWQALLPRLKKATFAFDTETTSVDAMQAELVGIAIALDDDAYYIPVDHRYPGAPDQLSRDQVLADLKPLLEAEPDVAQIVGQNLKYDRNVLRRYDIMLNNIADDTMLQSYVYDSVATRHDMDSLAQRYLQRQTIKFEEVAGKGAKQITFDQVDIDTATEYAAEDAEITLKLQHFFSEQLAQLPRCQSLYETLEKPLLRVLADMEYRGVYVDASVLEQQSQVLAERIQDLEQQAYTSAGQPFNLGSPKQIQEILFEQQKIPVIRKTPKGQPSTAEDVLEELGQQGYELPRLILEHRTLAKLKSTYTDKLPKQINPATGRVHTSYHQAVTSTGRLSSSDPNLQNIPIRNESGRLIRTAFSAPDGYQLMAADYSQVELRIMAHLSQDETLLSAFANEQDVHRITAAEVFDVDPDEVSDNQRRIAKATNFGLIYGMSAFGLAKQLSIPRDEAQYYINRYFEKYPGVRAYMDNTRKQARAQGFVETVMGRRLYLPEINSRNQQRRQYAERTAINAPMQGTAADIIKKAMLDVNAWLTRDHPDTFMTMQVHDELIIEVPKHKVDEVSQQLAVTMRDAVKLSVPLEVDVGTGDNWDEAH